MNNYASIKGSSFLNLSLERAIGIMERGLAEEFVGSNMRVKDLVPHRSGSTWCFSIVLEEPEEKVDKS